MGVGEAPEWAADSRVVRPVRHDPADPADPTRWPATVPAVEQLLCEGLELIAAVPGAALLELGDWGIRDSQWEDLHLVGAWRRFMSDPGSYFRRMQVG